MNISKYYLILYFIFTAAAETVTIHSGLYQNFPKIFTDSGGNPAGIFPEILNEIAKKKKWKITYKECHWNDCLQMLETGEIDVLPDVALTQERFELFRFHDVPVLHSWSGIWTRADLKITSIRDIQNLRIALLKGSVQDESLHSLAGLQRVEFKPVYRKSFTEAFAAVAEGKADAVSSNVFFAGTYGLKYRLKETPIIFNPAGLYFAFNRNSDPGLPSAVDHYLSEWKSDPDSPYFTALRNSRIQPGELFIPEFMNRAHKQVSSAGKTDRGCQTITGRKIRFCSDQPGSRPF